MKGNKEYIIKLKKLSVANNSEEYIKVNKDQ
jgi:hypothetical protein